MNDFQITVYAAGSAYLLFWAGTVNTAKRQRIAWVGIALCYIFTAIMVRAMAVSPLAVFSNDCPLGLLWGRTHP